MGVLLASLYDVEIKTERGRVIAWGHTGKQGGKLVIGWHVQDLSLVYNLFKVWD